MFLRWVTISSTAMANEKTTNGTDPLTFGEMSVKTGKQHPAIIDESET